MAKKKRKPSRQGKGPADWRFVLAAFGFGLLCIAAGAAVLVKGSGADVGQGGVATQDVSTVGYWLIGMGVAALALTLFIWRWRL